MFRLVHHTGAASQRNYSVDAFLGGSARLHGRHIALHRTCGWSDGIERNRIDRRPWVIERYSVIGTLLDAGMVSAPTLLVMTERRGSTWAARGSPLPRPCTTCRAPPPAAPPRTTRPRARRNASRPSGSTPSTASPRCPTARARCSTGQLRCGQPRWSLSSQESGQCTHCVGCLASRVWLRVSRARLGRALVRRGQQRRSGPGRHSHWLVHGPLGRPEPLVAAWEQLLQASQRQRQRQRRVHTHARAATTQNGVCVLLGVALALALAHQRRARVPP